MGLLTYLVIGLVVFVINCVVTEEPDTSFFNGVIHMLFWPVTLVLMLFKMFCYYIDVLAKKAGAPQD
jgi:Ca2+/H+ antiporter